MAPQRYTHQAVAQAHLVAVMAVVEIAKTQWGSEYFFQYLKYSDPIILFEVAEALGEESV
jgi:uncharacterized membrane protein YwzB